MSTRPLPNHPKIKIKDIPDMSVILTLDGNHFTEIFEKKVRGFPYTQVPTHAFIHVHNGDCIDVGWRVFNRKIHKIVRKSKRYIVISFSNIPPDMMDTLQSIAFSWANKLVVYDVFGFLGFGFRAYIPWLAKKWRPSKRLPFCSDNVIDIFQSGEHPAFTEFNSEETSPADLYSRLPGYQEAVTRELEV